MIDRLRPERPAGSASRDSRAPRLIDVPCGQARPGLARTQIESTVQAFVLRAIVRQARHGKVSDLQALRDAADQLGINAELITEGFLGIIRTDIYAMIFLEWPNDPVALAKAARLLATDGAIDDQLRMAFGPAEPSFASEKLNRLFGPRRSGAASPGEL